MTTDLTTSYLGLELANPLVASASPLTGRLETLVELQEAGIGAAVLPSLFEEQIEQEAELVLGAFGLDAEPHVETYEGYLPEVTDYNTGLQYYLGTLKQAKAELDIPIIASLNGTSAGGWTHYAQTLVDAGADALELNVYLVAADPDVSGAEVEAQYVELVEAVRSAVSVPLAVKIGPFFSSPGHLCRQLVDAGADGLVLFNRFYQPDIDLDELDVDPSLELSTSAELRLIVRWMAILHGRIGADLAATTGVHTADDVVKLLLSGADVVMTTSALLEHGAGHVRTLLDGVQGWFDERDYLSSDQARGSLSQQYSPDPSAFERSNYMKALISYASNHR